jgi:hypothetical protein
MRKEPDFLEVIEKVCTVIFAVLAVAAWHDGRLVGMPPSGGLQLRKPKMAVPLQ